MEVANESDKFDDFLIDEKTLNSQFYSYPDDLMVYCIFEVTPFTTDDDLNMPMNFNDNSVANCDLTINCSDGKNIKVHQFVLAKQCPTFKTKYKRKLLNNPSEIEFPYTSSVVQEVVRFFYTGKLRRVEGYEKEMMKIVNDVRKINLRELSQKVKMISSAFVEAPKVIIKIFS
jgi:hypothetical protein